VRRGIARRAGALARRRLAGLGGALVLLALLNAAVSDDKPKPPQMFTIDAGRTETATGFAIGGDEVMTVAHVLTSGPVTVDGHPAKLVEVDEAADLAILSMPGVHAATLRTATVAAGDKTSVGQVRRAITAHVDGQTRDAIELHADIRPGQSGTPVLSGDGRLAGVIFARSERRAHTAYAVTASPGIKRAASRRPNSVRTG
jgi:S1-C subfamily serine protease